MTAIASPKQINLVSKIRAEAATKLISAKIYAAELESAGKIAHATRMRAAISNLEVWLSRDENNGAAGGISVWITGTLQCLNIDWLKCTPK